MMKFTGLSHLFKWENLHNWWLTKYFFAPLYIYIQGSRVRPNFSRVRLTKIPGRTGASSHSRKEKKSIRDSETLWFNKRHPR